MPRPPEAVVEGTLRACTSDAPVSVETHLSPHGSDSAALVGLGVQDVTEAVDDARLRQTIGSASGMARVAGTQEVDAIALRSTRLAGRKLGRAWADTEAELEGTQCSRTRLLDIRNAGGCDSIGDEEVPRALPRSLVSVLTDSSKGVRGDTHPPSMLLSSLRLARLGYRARLRQWFPVMVCSRRLQ